MEEIQMNFKFDRSFLSRWKTTQTDLWSSERRIYRAVVLCLGLLSVFLLTGLFIFNLHYHNTVNSGKAMKANMNKSLQDSRNNMSSLTEERDQLNAKLSSLTEERRRLTARINFLTAERGQLNSRVSSLTSESNWLNSSLSSLTAERDQLNSTLSSLTAEKDQLNSTLSSLTAERDRLNSSLSSLTAEKDQLNSRVSSLSAERDRLNSSLSSLTAEKDRLNAQISNVTKEKDQLNATLSSLTEERSHLNAKISSLTEEMCQLDAQISNVTKEKDQLKSRLIEMTKDRDRLENLTRKTSVGWTKFNWSFYFLSTESCSWTKAREDCQNKGADLVIINSAEEQEFLSGFTNQSAWIGLTDIAEEGTWKWIDGSPLTFTNWNRGEPNDGAGYSTGGEDCAEIVPKGHKWNDLPCELSLQWICEKNI